MAQTGGGLYIVGTATLTNTNVYKNQADTVCSPFEHSVSLHPAPLLERYVLVFYLQRGGGLYVSGTATLTNTNVYSNYARYVCSPSALAQTVLPSPP